MSQPIISNASGAVFFDVVIVGGGLVGAPLALGLADAGLKVALIEQTVFQITEKSTYDGRTTAIAQGSKRIFETIGLWHALAAEAAPILAIRVSDGESRAYIHYDAADAGAPLGYIVENAVLRRALHAAVNAAPNIALYCPARFAAYEVTSAAARISLSSGEILRAPLIIAADGRLSPLREAAGISSLRADYHQTALVTILRHAEPHQNIAHERFLSTGPLALLPMQNPHRSGVVWTITPAMATHYASLKDSELAAEIERFFGSALGALSLAGRCWSWPLTMNHAKTYIAPRLALIGDAAHGIHPIAGQGVNLGWRDMATLAEILIDARRLGLDIGTLDILRRYETARQGDNTMMVLATDTLNRLFGSEFWPVERARQIGLKAIERLPPVKQFLMRRAMGTGGPLPRLARGEGL